MTKIYLIRHGEADGNLYRRMQGNYDGALTDLGYRQVEALGKRFLDIPLDAVYSSDLYRAMYTASSLCLPKKLPLHTDVRLREIHVGPLEDVPFGNARHDHPKEMEQFILSPEDWRFPGAETYWQLAERGYAALMDIVAENSGKTVAICAHGSLIMSVLCKLFYGSGHFRDAGHGANTSVTYLISENGEFWLQFKYDTSHLGEALQRVIWKPERGFSDLQIVPMGGEIEQYIRYRKDAWEVVYGSFEGFDGSGFWMDAQQTMGNDPEAMVVGYLDHTPVGMIQLSPSREEKKGVGYIPFLYLREAFRHKGLGIQLIGHAVSFYRRLGRKKLQLSVAPTNKNALAFYEKYGFRRAGKTRGRFGDLLLMEKDIALPEMPKRLHMIPHISQHAGTI